MRDRVRAVLEERLVTGELPPGQRLREEELSQELGVSRTPLREALLELERVGLVQSELARGFMAVPLRTREARNMVPVVAHLEALALSTVNLPLLLLDLPRLESLNARMAQATTPREIVDADQSMHDLLTSSCGNRHLLELLHGQKLLMRRYEYHYMKYASPADVRQSVAEHDAVFAALRERNMARATESLLHNWTAAWDRLLILAESRQEAGA